MTTLTKTQLLIVGAGPFGLSMAAHAKHLGIDHLVVGEPMRFWRANMPEHMYLRSACDWHLDPQDEDTIEAFLRSQGRTPEDVEPLSRNFYLEYANWFQRRKQIDCRPVLVERIDAIDDGGDGRFRATLADGGAIIAGNVLLAVGFEPFKHVPDDLARVLPQGRTQHTCDVVDFTTFRHQRCLIVGGRQSAFEWAALMSEAGAASVHLVYRHDSPAFAPSDWSWVNPTIDGMIASPGWYRGLSQTEKDAVSRRFWAEGRLKLEPWLALRVQRPEVTLWPHTRLVNCVETAVGSCAVTLDGVDRSHVVEIDRVVLATGYKVDITRVPLLARGNVLSRLQAKNGVPVLDNNLQSTVPGLFLTSLLATGDFGPFFGFTVAVRTSAKLVGQALCPD